MASPPLDTLPSVLSASVDFPAYVAMAEGPVPLTVRVAAQEGAGLTTPAMPVQSSYGPQPEEIEVVVSAEGFAEIKGENSRLLSVYPGRTSQPAVFLLAPQSPGIKRIVVDLYQRGRTAGSITLQSEVQAQASKQTASSLPAVAEPRRLELRADQAPPADLLLRVTLSHDQRQLSYLLHSANPELGYRWQPAGNVTLSDEPAAWAAQIMGTLGYQTRPKAKATSKGGGEDPLDRLDALGLRLGEALLSPELRRELQRLRELHDQGLVHSLLLISDEPSIPWELLKPDPQADFLCRQFRLGRWLAGPGLPGSLRIQRVAWTESRANPLRANAAAPPYFTDPARRMPLHVSQPLSSRQELLDELEAGRTQLVHLAGLAGFAPNNPERSVLVMGDGSLPLEQLVGQPAAGLARSRPLVFLNPSSADRTGWTATGLAGWAAAFIHAGATAFIGPLWDINDALAAQFAINFYDGLWEGLPLGEALFRARDFLHSAAPDDPAWLAFVLWGDPNGHVELAGEETALGDTLSSNSEERRGTEGNVGELEGTPQTWEALDGDARVWFVSANPKEGTNWDQAFALGRPIHWTKVSNVVGQRNIEQTRTGDLALAYSSSPRQEIVGLARISQNPDQQPDGLWAAWIEPRIHYAQGVTYDELKQATPDLAHIRNPMAAFSPVTPGQWRTISGLLAERNPAQQGQMPLLPDDAAPGLSWSPPRFPVDLTPGGHTTVQYALSNTGNVTLRRQEPLSIEAHWRLVDQPPDREPSGRQTWSVRVDADLGPGESLPVADLALDLPDAAGRYTVEWFVRADAWGNDVEPARTTSRIDVGSTTPPAPPTPPEPTPPEPAPPPAFAAQVQLNRQPPAELWPGERFDVAIQALNTGAEPWGERTVQARTVIAGAGEDARPVGSPYWLAAAKPGETVTVGFASEAPKTPGAYGFTLLVGPTNAFSQTSQPTDLPHSDATFAVLDLTTLSLAQLTGQTLDDLPADVRAQRLRALGQRLAEPGVAAQQRGDVIRDHLLPELFGSAQITSRAALQALFELRRVDATLDARVRQAIEAQGDALGALPGLTSNPTVAREVRRWLDELLPQEVAEQSAADGRTMLVLPAYAMAALPDLQAPAAASTAVVDIKPKEVTLTYGGDSYVSANPMAETGWQDKATRAKAVSPRSYGTFLFDTIFNRSQTGGVGSTYDGYVTARKQAKRRLRLELRIDPDVGSHKWEYLRNPFEQFGDQPAPPLAVYADAPLVRFYPNNEAAPAVEAKPLRILVAICNPTDLGKTQYEDGSKVPWYIRGLTRLDAAGLDRELRAVKPALQRLQDDLKIAEYKILGEPGDEAVTFERLTQELKNKWHVLHIIGHGVVVDGKYYLLMESANPGRTSDPVPPEAFEAPQFRQNLRLVVLSSCQSAVREEEAQQNLPSLAERLVRQGAQAVIAMQDVIRIDADRLFVQRFYEDLARSGRIDMAMAAARFDLYRDKPEDWDWGMPVLFMSTHDGELFDVEQRFATTAADERSSLEELQELAQPLPGDPDLAARVLSNSIQSRVRSASDDPELLSRLAAAIAPLAARPAIKPPPLARRQDRAALRGAQPVQLDGNGLAEFVRQETEMEIPARVFQQIAAAINGGKHVVLTGAPGTGKTTLAEAICRYAVEEIGCARGYTLTTATSDWTTFDTVGGLVPVESGVLQFRPGAVLETISAGHWLIVDEINRAEIDKAFGELFTVLSGQAVQLPHSVDGQPVRILPKSQRADWDAAANDESFDYWVHPSWRIIGTMNVYDKSYLFNMSFAFMRRFAFVDLDLPEAGQYEQLLERWLERAGLPAAAPAVSPGRQTLKDALARLLDQDSRLMRRRAIGPAIVLDVVRYLGQRRAAGDADPLDLLGYLAEAFQLYVTPQLDSLDRPGIAGIYQDVDTLFRALQTGPSLEHTEAHRLTLLRIQQLYPHIPQEEWDEFLQPQTS